jgi:hypothetical protein
MWQDSVLTGLRAAADLTCKKPDNAEPCKPTQQVKQRKYIIQKAIQKSMRLVRSLVK